MDWFCEVKFVLFSRSHQDIHLHKARKKLFLFGLLLIGNFFSALAHPSRALFSRKLSMPTNARICQPLHGLENSLEMRRNGSCMASLWS